MSPFTALTRPHCRSTHHDAKYTIGRTAQESALSLQTSTYGARKGGVCWQLHERTVTPSARHVHVRWGQVYRRPRRVPHCSIELPPLSGCSAQLAHPDPHPATRYPRSALCIWHTYMCMVTWLPFRILHDSILFDGRCTDARHGINYPGFAFFLKFDGLQTTQQLSKPGLLAHGPAP